ncbi:hypothetical protein MVEN_01129700 [Mycena venus]|uniref:F-box domain-containing protein n=1 Tax=Mycena venus TaxID=2733690 RepID=A0A8H6Y870_9AGAR|nr:hypothetical protein MVEN_01129700 [Mycena venus]
MEALAPLLRGNDPPTDLQAREARRLLDAANAELAALDDAISKLSLVPSQLQLQRQSHTESSIALRKVLSPIRRIPCEILGEIFLCCRNNSIHAPGYLITDPRETPLLLGTICSSWRVVSHNTPRVWDTVFLGTQPALDAAKALSMRALLERSRRLPLTISLVALQDPSFERDWSATTRWALDVVWDFHERLEHISLGVTAEGVVPRILPLEKPLPVLNSVNFIVHHRATDPLLAAYLDLFQTAPRLRVLKLEDPRHSDDILTSRFPWSQLISLDLDIPIDVLTARDILVQCTMLETARFLNIEGAVEDDTSVRPICTLNHLQTLNLVLGRGYRVASISDGPSADFITSFAMPKLNKLRIELSDWSADDLLNLHARSHFTLHGLSLTGLAFPVDELLPLLQLLTALQSLSLRLCDFIGSDLFRLFTYKPGSQAPLLLPHLRTLKLHKITDNLDGDVLVNMVDSLRNYAGDLNAPFPAIQSVEIFLEGKQLAPAIESRLATIRSSGFLIDPFHPCTGPSEGYHRC